MSDFHEYGLSTTQSWAIALTRFNARWSPFAPAVIPRPSQRALRAGSDPLSQPAERVQPHVPARVVVRVHPPVDVPLAVTHLGWLRRAPRVDILVQARHRVVAVDPAVRPAGVGILPGRHRRGGQWISGVHAPRCDRLAPATALNPAGVTGASRIGAWPAVRPLRSGPRSLPIPAGMPPSLDRSL